MNGIAVIVGTKVRKPNNDSLRLRLAQVRTWFCLAALLCCMTGFSLGQNKAFTNDDVIEMVRAGFNEETIIEAIRANKQNYDTSVEALVKLKNGGVSERVISAMLTAARTTLPPLKSDGEGAASPDEAGVYVLKDDRYVELATEAVDWRSKFFSPVTTVGNLTRSQLIAQLKGLRSPLQLSGDVELLIVCAEGVTAAEYHFIRAELNKNNRDFRVDFQALRGDVLIAIGGAGKSAMRFESEKIGAGMYRVRLRDLKNGEYAFLPPGTTTISGVLPSSKLYTFGLPASPQ
jgi:hypothetical protein